MPFVVLGRSVLLVKLVVLILPGDVLDVLPVVLVEAKVVGAIDGSPALRLPQAACT
jgi:hypothetical protein